MQKQLHGHAVPAMLLWSGLLVPLCRKRDKINTAFIPWEVVQPSAQESYTLSPLQWALHKYKGTPCPGALALSYCKANVSVHIKNRLASLSHAMLRYGEVNTPLVQEQVNS